MKKYILFILLIVSICASLAFAQAAPDPIRIATGARPLGMGKAFVGLADDLGSVFLNPAGVANPNRWQLTSMQGKFLEEFNYLSLSGLYPTPFGNFGIGYIRSDISGALPTTIEAGSDPDDPIYVIDVTQDPMSYSNNLFLFSYGSKLKPLFELPFLSPAGESLPWLKDINVGANFKLYNVSLTGDGITDAQGSGSGTELDIGIQARPLAWLALGSSIQNALPMDWGGKLRYESGWEESFAAVLKLGAAVDVIGPANSLWSIGNHQLKALLDMDYEIKRADNIPILFHLGLEWKPIDLIAIRAGIDQDMIGRNQVASNLTGGAGIYYGDFRFDYAYHVFEGAPGIDNHFFSLSYGIKPVKPIVDRLIAYPDKIITVALVTSVEGTAVDPVITAVEVKNINVALSPRAEFQTRVSLNVGKNAIMVEGLDSDGNLVASKKLRILRLITYPDVMRDYWAYDQINYIGTLGIIQGYPDGTFRPEGNITRAEMAALLARTKTGGEEYVPPATDKIFTDMPLSHWAAKYVNLAAESEIVLGYPDKSFRPGANITRAEGLAMIARFGGVKEVTYNDEFADVAASHWAAPIIAGAWQEGMLIWLKGKPFEPNRKLTRAEAVEMLFRSKPVAALVKDLLDFETGY